MVIRVLDNRVIVLFDPDDASKTDLDLKAIGKKWNPEHQYAFDYVFDEESSQDEVYNNSSWFMVEGTV